jgi:phasin family protein
MATTTIDQITTTAKANVEKLTVVAKDNAEALTKSGNVALSGFDKLAKAYQDVATRNLAKFNDALKALSSVKTPVEFVELQAKLVKEGFDAAITDSRAITELTTSVFTEAFEPVKKQVEAVQSIVLKAA